MNICHVIHKSKKFWNSARWQNHRFLLNYLIWKTKRVKNQETECKCLWRQSCKLLKMFTHQGEMLIGLKKSNFLSKFCFWQRIESICRLKLRVMTRKPIEERTYYYYRYGQLIFIIFIFSFWRWMKFDFFKYHKQTTHDFKTTFSMNNFYFLNRFSNKIGILELKLSRYSLLVLSSQDWSPKT